MSLGFDPILSNLLLSLSLIPHFGRPQPGQKLLGRLYRFPYVSVLVALYQESREDTAMTVSSLLNQTYPNERYEVIVIVEPDDEVTRGIAEQQVARLCSEGIASKVIQSDGLLRIKPRALNIGLAEATGEYCAFYDAADTIDKTQIEQAVGVMESLDCDVAQAMVLRKGSTLLNRLLFMETLLWFRKYLPFVLRFAGGFPLSGEGLFIRKRVLDEVGGFPETLAEDAEMGLRLTGKRKTFVLLDSQVVEKGPRDIRAHITQKVRWFRGYLSCLFRLFTLRLPLRSRLLFFILFVSPISSALALLGWLLLLCLRLHAATMSEGGTPQPWLPDSLHANLCYYWSLALMYVGIPLGILSHGHTLWASKLLRYAPLLVLLPAYWVLVGLCGLLAIFRRRSYWGKTRR